MTSEQDDLAEWCRRERKDALRQLELFGSGGVKAVLQMPDGTMQDITEAVIKHQTANVAVFERLVAALTPGA
jgi:hypothetical protein